MSTKHNRVKPDEPDHPVDGSDSPFPFSPLSAPSCRSAFLPVALDKESAFMAIPTTFDSCGEDLGDSDAAGAEFCTTETDLLMLGLGDWFGTTQGDWLCPPLNMNSSSGRSILRFTGSLSKICFLYQEMSMFEFALWTRFT